MIYTLTLNPALDRTLTVEKLIPDETIRVLSEERYAAGKGIDVSRVIKELGGRSIALGFVGGYDGLELEGRLINDGVLSSFVRISGNTRTNIILKERASSAQYVISAPGPHISAHELSQLYQQIISLSDLSYLIISGSIPPGLKPTVYSQFVVAARDKGATVALDADGEAMKEGVRAAPDIIKPNVRELARLVGREVETEEEIMAACDPLFNLGTSIAMVSRGAKGILTVTHDDAYRCAPPPIEVQNTVGAGDSALAAFILCYSRGGSLAECTARATAAGTATAMAAGTALATREDVDRLAKDLKSEVITRYR
ncbi:MAG: 1-phosphofructokinase [Pseudomonadota bacterium]